MSIYEVTNLDTGKVAFVDASDHQELSSYFPHIKIATLDPVEDTQVIYYLNGKRHNDHGPAVIYGNGTKRWYSNGNRHNENGPAIVWYGGVRSWYINNKRLIEEQFNEYLRSHQS